MNKAKEFSKEHHNIHISWCLTLSTLNIYNLPETLEYFYKYYSEFGIYLNLVHQPTHFNIAIMPDDVKAKVVAKLESIPKHYTVWDNYLPGIIQFIKSGTYNPAQWKEFKNIVKIHDDYRGQQFATVFSEYAKIVGL